MIAFTWLVWIRRLGMGYSTRFILMDRVLILLEDDDDGLNPSFQVREFPDAAAAQVRAIRETASYEGTRWEFTGSVMMDLIDFVDLENFLKLCRQPEAFEFVVSIANQILQHGRELG